MSRRRMPRQPSMSSIWQVLLIIILSVGLLGMLVLFTEPASVRAERLRIISVPLHAEQRADYSVDTYRNFLPPLSLDLLREVIREQLPLAWQAEQQFVSIIASLDIEVPTVTPYPVAVLDITPSPTGTIEPTISVTSSDVPGEQPEPSATTSVSPPPLDVLPTATPEEDDGKPKNTHVPPKPSDTDVPPTAVPSDTSEPPTTVPPTAAPPTKTARPTTVPPTSVPPTISPPTSPTSTSVSPGPSPTPQVKPTRKPTKTPKPKKTKVAIFGLDFYVPEEYLLFLSPTPLP